MSIFRHPQSLMGQFMQTSNGYIIVHDGTANYAIAMAWAHAWQEALCGPTWIEKDFTSSGRAFANA